MTSKQLKFLLVIDNLSTGGAQRQMINLAVGLTRRGYQVEVFCYSHGDLLAKPLLDENIPIHWMQKNSRYSFDVILNLKRLIVEGAYDLVLSFLTTPNFYALIAARILARRVPVVVSERFCDLPQGINRTEKFVRIFYNFASHLVVNSHHQRDNFVRKYPALGNRLSTIYNGYDLKNFYPPDHEPNHGSLKILTIASVSPYKNGLCLVEALNLLKKNGGCYPAVTWVGQRVLAGERLVYLRNMEEKIEQYELVDHWKWLDQRTDIVTQFHQHDVLVHPSYGEGLPNVVCEALACGRPIILSNVLDHPRLVQDGKSGYLFDWQDPADLAEKIRLFDKLSCDERANLGRNGRRFAEAHLSMERYIDEYEKLFLNILKEE